jgi:trans-aconitate 2-methyltransferase
VRWDPEVYLARADERSRPFHDLLARVGARDPSLVVDLGCGPGTLTRTLLDRWPGARVAGLDSSPEMVARAARHGVPGRLTFAAGDVRTWSPGAPVDVVVANAVLQWVPGYLDLLARLVGALVPGGWLALQLPANHDAPTHRLLAEVAARPRWRDALRGTATPWSAPAEEHLSRLAGTGCDVDAWETTYLHVLAGEDAVLGWVRGTALRPVLTALPEADHAEFLAEYGALLREAYPPAAHGTVLPYRRTFAVARRPS